MKIALAAFVWVGVLLQLYLSIRLGIATGKGVASGIVSFLSYFTVWTNFLVCAALTLPLMAPASGLGRFFSRPSALAWVATSIAIVSIGYHFLVRHVWSPQGLQLVADNLLHYAVPVVFVAYWWLAAPKASLRWIDPLIWSAYPVAYVAYALPHGALTGSYAYPFIDVATIGYQQTLLNVFVLLLAYVALGLLLVAIGRTRVGNKVAHAEG